MKTTPCVNLASIQLKQTTAGAQPAGEGLSGARMFVAALQWAHAVNQSTDDDETNSRSDGSGAAEAAAAADATEDKLPRHRDAAAVVERDGAAHLHSLVWLNLPSYVAKCDRTLNHIQVGHTARSRRMRRRFSASEERHLRRLMVRGLLFHLTLALSQEHAWWPVSVWLDNYVQS
jgi:hypothetical protein